MYQSEQRGSSQEEAAPLDCAAIEAICTVVRRALSFRYRGVSPDLVHDAVQEAACKFYEEQEKLRAEANSRTAYAWICTAAVRELSHVLRYKDRFILLSGTGEYHACIPPEFPGDNGVESILSSATPGDQLTDVLTYHTLLGSLSQNLAEAVQLHFEGYTADEIAQQVGCSEAAAYKRVQRGRVELRQLWKEEESRLRQLLT